MIDFEVNRERCTRCGSCSKDCPSRIIVMDDEGFPSIAADKEPSCLRCEHCLAICPAGAISILGFRPENSLALKGGFPDPKQLETLIRGRRSVRRYLPDNLDPELLQKLLDVASCAPTGMNSHQVRFTVLDDRAKVLRLNQEVMEGLARLDREGALLASKGYYGRFVRIWEKHRVDLIFRDAPHLLIASAPKSVSTPKEDCMIALSFFELFAQTQGIGTLWNGLASWAIDQLLPEIRRSLGIADDHMFGYAMTFGKPAVHYARTVQHHPANAYRP
ncbi:MAG: 4Fe-4S dicluster domain-containing protein [Chlorobiaceae bacterium]|nr:4Fe-4S dicluster domain-containing protein [Chlorobiaceae bacterium]